MALYRWNLRASTAFYESIHYFEVALRNTVDESIAAWHHANHADSDPWYRCPAMPLTPQARGRVLQAIRFATRSGTRPELHGRVLCELSFGFWRSLFSDAYSRTLWQPCLREAFPRARRGRLHDAIGEFLVLRNRIAHYEPIHNRDLDADYRMLLKTSGFVHPALAQWISHTSLVPQVIGERPR
ncbi:MAG: hypothetical protein LBK72_02290 [Bifidobacteriaceae bacterium]|nr:hypothetical protein [Bifidobacteriaceae bacterium]